MKTTDLIAHVGGYMATFDRAQERYDAMEPPGYWEDPEAEDDEDQ